MGQAFIGKDVNLRRFHQKELFYRLPARPFLKFLLLYVCKRGFLDGIVGFRYAMLQSFYEYMIVLKTKELIRKQDAPVPVGRASLTPGVATANNFLANRPTED